MKRTITIHYINTAGLSQRQAESLIDRLRECIRTKQKLPTMYVYETVEIEVPDKEYVHMAEQGE